MTRHLRAAVSWVSNRLGAAAPDVRSARGAILVWTAGMLVGLTAFSAFVIDYGILWAARRQIQNTADAAALAAANSLAFDAPGDLARARASALAAAARNPVWAPPGGTAVPVMNDGDITFPTNCPAGAIGVGPCVRVEAFRNQGRGNPLPTIFAYLAGKTQQGVQATATAQVLYGDSIDCVRPMAIPDKWNELFPAPQPWTEFATFQRYQVTGVPIPNGDYYEPPGGGLFGPNGTGFSRGGGDYGLPVSYLPALAPYKLAANQRAFLPVRIGSGGPSGFFAAMTSCTPNVVGPGSVLQLEDSIVTSETIQAGTTLLNMDPGAQWDPSLNGGRGGVAGGCMASASCVGPNGALVSPRIIAIPAFNPDAWDSFPPGTNTSVQVTRILGFFVEGVENGRIYGHLMVYPVIPRSTMTASPDSSFIVSVTLVR
jgi:hypothetical protein